MNREQMIAATHAQLADIAALEGALQRARSRAERTLRMLTEPVDAQAQLDGLPRYARVRDRDGDTWEKLADGCWIMADSQSVDRISSVFMARFMAPFEVLEAAVPQSAEPYDVPKLHALPVDARAMDKDGDIWVKTTPALWKMEDDTMVMASEDVVGIYGPIVPVLYGAAQ